MQRRKDSSKFTSVLLGAACGMLIANTAFASSHREAPAITKYPQVDGTDFYMFNSYEAGRDGYVTFIANYNPIHAAYGGPNYFPLDPNGLYEIHIDNNGDAVEDLTLALRPSNSISVPKLDIDGVSNSSVLKNIMPISAGSEPGLAHVQNFTVDLVSGDRRTGTRAAVTAATGGATAFRIPFDYSGQKTFGGPGGYKTYADSFITDIDLPNCAMPGKVFVGQRYEAFKLALGEVFDLVNFAPVDANVELTALGAGVFFPGITQDPARNSLIENNVTTIAFEIHKSCLGVTDTNTVLGAWTTASLRQATLLNPDPTVVRPEAAGGAWTQVSRLSSPLVNELVIGYDLKDSFNSSEPKDDGTSAFAAYVTNPVLPRILDILFKDTVNGVLGSLSPPVGPLPDLAPSNYPRTDLLRAFLTGFAGVNANGSTAEMLRLNTAIPAVVRENQSTFGVAGGDAAGFPNGRRPGDDVVDIALRVVMGALCYPVPIDLDASGTAGDAGDTPGGCVPSDAPVGFVPFTDGVPLSATELDNTFPYLLTPYPGSPFGAPEPTAN
ncbi:DUF4331 domain-containing protein [Aurantivibrio infirmus]